MYKILNYLSVLIITAIILSGSSSLIAGGKTLTLTNDGKSEYTIVLTRDASPSEKHAAKELQKYLSMISGVAIPIYRDNEKISGPMILVGDGPLLRQIDSNIDIDDLGDEGFIIRTRTPHIIIAGGKARGTMYAVYSFLEDVLGCRWYTHEISHIPSINTIRVETLDIKEKPAFVQRLLNARDAYTEPDWAARNKVNSGSNLGVTRGGTVVYQGGHTTYHLVSPYTYFNDHPEYYSLLNGSRQWEYAQLCASNPEVAGIAARSILDWIEMDPSGVAYNVGQEDWSNYCLCSECSAINDREESAAGTNIHLVNAVAEKVEKVFPDKNVGTFAYSYTEKPPKYLRTRDNLAIRLAIIQGCDAHPLEQCPQNAAVAENVKGWAAVCDHIYIWDYTNDFSHLLLPFPNWWSNHEDLKLFNRIGIDGVFMQGCSFTESGAMEELQVYVQAKLLWNPDRDVWAIVDEFLNGYYGPAAPAMRSYVDLFQDKVRNLDNHFTLFSSPTVPHVAPDMIHQADKILDQAERAAMGRPDILHLLQKDRLCLRYIKMTQPIKHVKDGSVFKPEMADASYDNIDMRELHDFMETCRDHEIIALNEWSRMFNRHHHMRANLGGHTLTPLENDLLKMEFLPTIGGRMLRMYDKKRGKELLYNLEIDKNVPSSWNATFMAGGFDFGMANQEIFYPKLSKTQNGNQLTLTGYLTNNGHARTENSFLETREIFLPTGKSEIQVTQTIKALIPIARPQSTSTSPVFKLGNVQNLKVGIAAEDGSYKWEPVSFSGDNPDRFSRSFGEREIRGGSCCVINPEENIGVVVTFDPAQLRSCNVRVNSKSNTVSLSLRGNQVTYKPGDTLTFRYTYEIIDDVNKK